MRREAGEYILKREDPAEIGRVGLSAIMYTCATMAYSIQLQTTLTDINFVVYKGKKKAYKQVIQNIS